jgi:pimeloyl-ACP methyl ester carboxylesterase
VVSDSYRRVRINGAELAYIEQGTGAPFVYVHGAVSDVRYLQPELPALAQRFRTIVYSRRYAWPNEALGEDALDSIAQHVDDLAGLIRALDAAPAHVAGISSGGAICLLLAVRHPELVRTLILEDPAAFSIFISIPPKPSELVRLLLTQPGTFLMMLRIGASVGSMAAAAKRGADEEAIRLMINWANGFDAYSEIPPDGKAQVRANKAPFVAGLRHTDPIGLTATDARRIRKPTLLISGERSAVPLRAVVHRLAELIPNSEVRVIPDASHGMNYQNPGALDAAILDFLEKHPAA